MRTLTCNEPFQLSLTDHPFVHASGDGLVIEIKAIGICGTDYHIYQGNQPYLSYPRVMGHELSGTVTDTAGSDRFAVGDKVVVIPYLSCGDCGACRIGKTNCCENIAVLGVHKDGGMCERIAVPEENLIHAGGLSFDQAAMIEFLSIGRHAVARAGMRPDGRVLVIGAGPIGLATAAFAALEAPDVTIADVAPERLAMSATRFGFKTAELSSKGPIHLPQSPFDYVYDATGIFIQ